MQNLDFKKHGDMTEPVNFFKGVLMGLVFSAGIVALVWLMLSY